MSGTPEAGWRARAACLGSDPALFYPEHYTAPSCLAARRICAGCPVKIECLEDAAVTRERLGIRGGLTPFERGASSWRTCKNCGAHFDYAPQSGQPKAYCTDICRDEARSVKITGYQLRRAKSPGLMFDRGHGRPRRYANGCRCRACRKAAAMRQRRARLRRVSTESGEKIPLDSQAITTTNPQDSSRTMLA